MAKINISDIKCPNGLECQELTNPDINNIFGGISAIDFINDALKFLEGHDTVLGHWQNGGSGDGSGFLFGTIPNGWDLIVYF